VARREASLKAAFADWYPELRVGIWYPADQLTDAVLRQLQQGAPTWHSEDRVPSDAHFHFRGGEAPSQRTQRTRRGDTSR
jgi:hypothetical protein